MSQPDLRMFTSFGEKLLADHNDSFRKQLREQLEAIASKLSSTKGLSEEQKNIMGSFLKTGRTIVEKASKITP